MASAIAAGEQDPKSPFLFTSERGSPFTTAGFVERAGVEAKLGFPAHPHMLRHACSFALANKGHDTRALRLRCDGLPGIASEEAESKVRLLRNVHLLSRTDLGDLALAGGLRLRLLFKLLGLGRDELGKTVAHLRLGTDVRGRRSRSRGNLARRHRRDNRRQAGVVDYTFRQFLVGTGSAPRSC